MTSADRKMEIVSILVVSGHITSRKLAQEFDVCIRTIRNDITVLSYGYSNIHKAGNWLRNFYHGGIQAIQQYAYIIRAGKTQKNV